VSQERIGEWIKEFYILSDIADKSQRNNKKGGRVGAIGGDCLTSNIMQRHAIIREVKSLYSKVGKPITIGKQ